MGEENGGCRGGMNDVGEEGREELGGVAAAGGDEIIGTGEKPRTRATCS